MTRNLSEQFRKIVATTMFKLQPSLLVLASLCVYASAELQLLVPNDNLALLSNSGKSVQVGAAASQSIDSSENQTDDISSSPTENDSSTSSDDEDDAASAPASVKRTSISQIGGGSASNRHALLLTSSSSASGLPIIQHQILPAQAIPLPISIATRAGLRTIIAPETITIHQPTVAKIGEVVQRIPTAVSHQSQTVVHKHARVVTPIVAPAVRSITQQVVRAIHQPLVLAPQTRVISLVNH